MKILYITNYDTMGGANHSLLGMMRILKDKYEVEPSLLVPGGGIIGKKCEEIGIKVYKYDFRITYIDGKERHPKLKKITRRVMRYTDFYRILKHLKNSNEQFDLIHSNSSIFDIGFFLANKLGTSHIWHMREYGAQVYELYPTQSIKQMVKQYNRSYMIAISQAIKDKLLKMGCDGDHISLIYNGVRIPEAYKKEYNVGNIYNFCIVGGILKGKNQLDVVNACKLLWDKGYSNFHLHIVGDGDKDYREKIINSCGNGEFSKHVIMHGRTNDVYELLKNMDIGIMASTFEAFGRVTVEYMANYMPVIATDSGANLELVDDVRNIFKVHDINRLAEIMEEFVSNKRTMSKEGFLARKKAEAFSEEKNAENVYKLYKSVKGITL